MGLTNSSVGKNANDSGILLKKISNDEKIIALAGNPNVGKSTVFNALTGMKQHTGNWPGKTVTNATGRCESEKNKYILVDIPGTYSLSAHSEEEEVARDFVCYENPDAVAVVCDATCLERNLNLVLQILEVTKNTVVCVNLMDEAKRKGIEIDIEKVESRLGVPVVATVARKKKSLENLLLRLDETVDGKTDSRPLEVFYGEHIERSVKIIKNAVEKKDTKFLNPRSLSLKLLDCDEKTEQKLKSVLGEEFFRDGEVVSALEAARQNLLKHGITPEKFRDITVSKIMETAENVCRGAVFLSRKPYSGFDRKTDRILTGKLTGYPVMILLLAFIFWLTVVGANYPSEFLSEAFSKFGIILNDFLLSLKLPYKIVDMTINGVYKTLSWVVAVMLPPMAVFFPLFTLLEDCGYLPRVAYNLDKPFKKCSACGKQSLTMCMGFGCNAAGVVGCRIIDGKREKLLAVLTNSFVPCNGRFPTLISLITVFFVGTVGGVFSSVLSAVILTGVILLGVSATFLTTKFLSKTVLKGEPSSFTLELPPYRKPQIGSVIVRSVFDRTLFVLGRAAAVAAPAGLIIWIAANCDINGISILHHCAAALDPFAKLLGLDGVILMAFILGFPANEIVIPIVIMAYLSKGSLMETASLEQMRVLFVENGWTFKTALCTVMFSLFHWPCSTTVLTIKKETGSLKWTALSVALPTIIGMALCFLTNLILSAVF